MTYKTFCYPYGGYHTFTPSCERILEDLGCILAFSVESRDVKLQDILSRPYAIPRYDCNEFAFGKASLG